MRQYLNELSLNKMCKLEEIFYLSSMQQSVHTKNYSCQYP